MENVVKMPAPGHQQPRDREAPTRYDLSQALIPRPSTFHSNASFLGGGGSLHFRRAGEASFLYSFDIPQICESLAIWHSSLKPTLHTSQVFFLKLKSLPWDFRNLLCKSKAKNFVIFSLFLITSPVRQNIWNVLNRWVPNMFDLELKTFWASTPMCECASNVCPYILLLIYTLKIGKA